jgi:predicted ribosome quality control (RQC) complex YloA/Tae2 family protein
MKIELDARKSVHDNAAVYYNKAKRIRAKIPGLKKAIADTKKAIEAEEASEAAYEPPQKKAVREREWFEKFHWLRTSGGFLAIGGRDAKGNEAIVARHMEQNDLFFHADVAGASAVVLKNGQAAAEQDLAEVAQMAACFSRAWQSGTEACDVYCVKPGQVKTAAKAGEYLAKGSFVILGERKWFRGVRLAACCLNP